MCVLSSEGKVLDWPMFTAIEIRIHCMHSLPEYMYFMNSSPSMESALSYKCMEQACRYIILLVGATLHYRTGHLTTTCLLMHPCIACRAGTYQWCVWNVAFFGGGNG